MHSPMIVESNSNTPINGNLFAQISPNNNTMTLLKQKALSKNSQNCKAQTTNFIKTSINSMIRDQIKSYRLQKKLDRQLQAYKKNKDKQQLIQNMHQITKFRQTESEQFQNQFDDYVKNRSLKESRIQEIKNRKFQLMQKKKLQNQRKMQHNRQKYNQALDQDTNHRLSRAESIKQKLGSASRLKLISSARSFTQTKNYKTLIQSRILVDQQNKITNYLKKMKHAQSRIIVKQLKNEQRVEKSFKSTVKNLTKQRDLKEEMLTKKYQQQYNTKMQTFIQKVQQSKLENSMLLQTKFRERSSLRDRVIKNKQLNHSQLITKTLEDYQKKQQRKFNSPSHKKQNIDLLRTKSSLLNKSIKLEKQALVSQNQKNMRIFYEKLNKVKRLNPNQVMPAKQREQLIKALDKNDPQYPEMIEFLTHTKTQFMKRRVQKEEEKAKAQKIKKTLRSNNKN